MAGRIIERSVGDAARAAIACGLRCSNQHEYKRPQQAHFFAGRSGLAVVMRYSTDFPSQCVHAPRVRF